ncbi:hypothetical protein EYC80_005931 [Monilinia laxa]|uniref:Deoxyuridine 5'-triphosphate nucleotidohydrolase n=1 Tax=Monilinia laxa TaxID=61186 RepID=A0A5N6KFR8_MONLA|nr:hypothetical protein EYC80_005931 [Monilinia laxa]
MSTLPPQSPSSPLPKRQKTSPSKTTTETAPLATTSTSNSLQEIMSSAPLATAPAAAPAAAPNAAPTTGTTAPAPVAPARTSNGTTNTTAHKSSTPPPLLIKKLSPRARLPTRGSAFAAGYDIYAAKETVVPAKGKVLVDTDISMAVPDGTYGRIAPRSGLASKHMIDTGAGVIDADYRGQVKVLLFNHGEKDFEVKEGDRVAQLILERIYTPEVTEVLVLEESVRGEGGFGMIELAERMRYTVICILPGMDAVVSEDIVKIEKFMTVYYNASILFFNPIFRV